MPYFLSSLRRLSRGSCCTLKFSLSFLKAFLTRILKNSSLHKYNWIFQHQVKEETVKRGKTDKNGFFKEQQVYFDSQGFDWTLVSFKPSSISFVFVVLQNFPSHFSRNFWQGFWKIQACTSTIGFSSIKLKRKLLKKDKADKNNFFDKIGEKTSLLRFTRLRLD